MLGMCPLGKGQFAPILDCDRVTSALGKLPWMDQDISLSDHQVMSSPSVYETRLNTQAVA